MRGPLLAAALAAAAAFGAPPALAQAAAQAPAPAQRDWARSIVATPEGGFRMGNPEAAVRLVEYVSLTCPHCQAFSAEGAPRLIADHVRSGRLSFEIRPFPLDVVAAVGAQLTRCAAPAQAFALNDAILAGQTDMFGRLQRLTPAEVDAITALAAAEQRVRIAAIVGIDTIGASHGIDAAAAQACLADQAGADRIEAIRAAAEEIGIRGTPSFTLNGIVQQGVHDWAALAPLLGN